MACWRRWLGGAALAARAALVAARASALVALVAGGRSYSASTTTTAPRRTRPVGSTTISPSSTRRRDASTRSRPGDARSKGAGVEGHVVGLVGDSPTIAARWGAPAGLVFIDGGHGAAPAWADYHGWAPAVAMGGWMAIHDVFPNPTEGGRPPYELYLRALESAAFVEETEMGCGSLRVLRRVAAGV